MFPDVTSSLSVSQLSYQSHPSQEVIRWFEQQKEEFAGYMRSNERKVAIQRAEVDLQEKQVKKVEKESERQEKLAMSFFLK